MDTKVKTVYIVKRCGGEWEDSYDYIEALCTDLSVAQRIAEKIDKRYSHMKAAYDYCDTYIEEHAVSFGSCRFSPMEVHHYSLWNMSNNEWTCRKF